MGNCVPDLRRFQVMWTPTKVWVQPQPPGPQVKVRLLVGLRERKRVLPSCELWLLSGRTTPAPRGASQQPVWAGGAIASPPSPLEESETSGRWNGFAQDASVCYWLVESGFGCLPPPIGAKLLPRGSAAQQGWAPPAGNGPVQTENPNTGRWREEKDLLFLCYL